MKNTVSFAALLALTLGGSALFADRAEAACGPDMAGKTPAVYRDGVYGGSLLRVGDHEDDSWEWAPKAAPIVGLWRFSWVSEGSKGIPNGAPVDAGFQAWHSDGTEIMNSGRAPMTGSFCMGVWKQTGHDTFELNHYAVSWDPTGTVEVGVANIHETLTVDKAHDTFTGTFTLDQYASDNKTLLAHVQGKATGTRITVDCKGLCIK